MYIEKIISYDSLSKEADIIISDGKFGLLCYAFEYNNNQNSNKFTLLAFSPENIVRSEVKQFKIEKNKDSYYGYKLIAQVIDKNKGIVSINKIRIKNIETIPSDINDGEFIEFLVSRIDYIC